MKKILICILLATLFFSVGCDNSNGNFSDTPTGGKENSTIEKPDSEESSNSGGSSDNDSSKENEEDNSSKEESSGKEGNDWSFIY